MLIILNINLTLKITQLFKIKIFMFHLGINYYGHDTSVALFKGDKLIFAIEEERLTRKKHDASLPLKSIEYVTKKFKLNNKNVKSVNFATIPERILSKKHIDFYLDNEKEIDFFETKSNQKKLNYLLNVRSILKKKIKFNCEFNFHHHHLCHQYGAYYLSGFKSAACFSIDGLGEIESMCYGTAKNNKVKIFKSLNYPNSLGETYTAVTDYLGYTPESSEGTVMALAALGNKNANVPGKKKTFYDFFKEIIKIDNKYFNINLEWFDFWRRRKTLRVSRKFTKIFGKKEKSKKISENKKNIAAALQARFEDAYISLIENLLRITKEKNLVISGGCALNCKANGSIKKKFNLKRIYIQPAAGDNGLAVGAAYAGFLKFNNYRKNNFKEVEHSYFGPAFTNSEIKKYLNKNRSKINYKYITNIEKYSANLLKQKKILGWFQGRMEFGPRALGNRSILASPTDISVKDRLNRDIKNREYFRPFAPAVLKEKVNKIFNLSFKSPFMLIASKLKVKKPLNFPAILHYDNTARVQAVEKKTNKRFYKLINQFYKITKVPMLLNTSFNGKGEPIVCNPQDAISCFLKNKMDYLILGNYFVQKRSKN